MEGKNTSGPLKLIFIGFVLYSIGAVLFDISAIISYAISGIGLMLITAYLTRFSYKLPFTGTTRLFFLLYLIWNIIIILRPLVERDFSNRVFSPFYQFSFLAFIVPFVCLIYFRKIPIIYFISIKYVYGLIGLLLVAVFFNKIFAPNQNLEAEDYQDYIGVSNIPTVFLLVSSFNLLWFNFLTRSKRIATLIIWGVAITVAAFAGRRGNVFIYLLVLAIFLMQYIFYSTTKNRAIKILGVLCTIVIISIYIFNNLDNMFSLLISRLDEDTRSGVESYFYKSFQGQTLDWIVGRGLNGTYYCPFFSVPNRDTIETGYLFLILKGGVINLFFFVYFIAQSAYLGFFKTKNRVTKVMALYLIIHLILLVPFGLPSFSLEYLLVWVFVLLCQSKIYRMYTTEQILDLSPSTRPISLNTKLIL